MSYSVRIKSSFGDVGKSSWCCGRGVVQCIWSNVYLSYSTHTTCIKSSFGDFGHHSWCYDRGVQCICELFHTHQMHQKLVWRFWTPFVVLRSWGRGVVQCIRELFRTHHMNEKLVCRFWTWCYGRGAVQSYSTLHHMHEKLVWRFGTPFMVLRSGVVQCICDLFHTHHMPERLVWRFWTPFMVLLP